MMKKIWDISGQYNHEIQPDLDKGLQRLRSRMEMEKSKGKIIRSNRFGLLRWAAAVMALIGIGFLINKYSTQEALIHTKTADNQTRKIELIDGTVVWLNEFSHLEYPGKFHGNTRTVHLQGEAYFDVARNEAMPFIIDLGDAKIKVLGTAFNVRNYPAEPQTVVEVAEGKVALSPSKTNNGIQLVKGDRGIFETNTATLFKETGAALNPGAWHLKTLRFENTPIQIVIQEIEKYYGVTIRIDSKTIRNCTLNSHFQDETLSNVLLTIERVLGCTIKASGKGIYHLTGGNSCE